MPIEHQIPSTFQWEADTSRLLKSALRIHDPDGVATVFERISEKHGRRVAEDFLQITVTRLMSLENWSFFNEETGEPSPLL